MPKPGEEQTHEAAAAHLMIAPAYTDPKTGALYVHSDLVKVKGDWLDENHLPPTKADEKFGDLDSFVAYVARFAREDGKAAFVTWNSKGLRAVLDYHEDDAPNRCQWTAAYDFVPSPEWASWIRVATGQAIAQKQLVELLEDRASDIRLPDVATLLDLLRSLRANVSSTASTELRADGTTNVVFAQDKTIRGGANAAAVLPPEIQIAVPVLKGHVDESRRPVAYQLTVRVRASVDEAAKLSFRLSIPNAERVLEDVYAERVAAAKVGLGDPFTVLRAAG